MAAPEVKSFADLKGKTVSVDAMTTGFAFVLRELLARNGLAENDVTFVRVGGGAQRLEALLKKEQAGTLLNTPLDLVAEAKGFNRLARARDELGAYQGIVAAMRRDTAQRMKPQAQAFIRGFHASVGWLADGANRDEALGDPDRADARHGAGPGRARLREPARPGRRHVPRPAHRPGGLATVLRLRSTYAQPRKTLSDPSRHVDLSHLEGALKR